MNVYFLLMKSQFYYKLDLKQSYYLYQDVEFNLEYENVLQYMSWLTELKPKIPGLIIGSFPEDLQFLLKFDRNVAKSFSFKCPHLFS